MKRIHLAHLILLISIFSVFSQTATIRNIQANPLNFPNVTVNGIVKTGQTKCTMIACQTGICCNSCVFDSIRITDGTGELDFNYNSSFSKKYYNALSVSECHTRNLRFFTTQYAFTGRVIKVTISNPSSPFPTTEMAVLMLSNISEENKSLLYIKDTVFVDKKICNDIDRSILIMNPQSEQISLDSLFVDSCELTDKEQGVNIVYTDTLNVQTSVEYKVTAVAGKKYNYLLTPIDTKNISIKIPSHSWVTLSSFRYTSDPMLTGSKKSAFDHPAFTMNLLIKDSKKETQKVILKYSAEYTSSVTPSIVKSNIVKRTNTTMSINLTGKKISTMQNVSGMKVTTDGLKRVLIKK